MYIIVQNQSNEIKFSLTSQGTNGDNFTSAFFLITASSVAMRQKLAHKAST